MSINIKELLCTTALASSFLLGVCDVSATEEKNSGGPTEEQANIALSASDATATSNQNASDQTGEQANIALNASDATATSNQNASDQTAGKDSDGENSEAKVQSKDITQLLGELDEELTKISDSKEKKEKQNDEEIPDAFIQQMVGMDEAQIEKCWKAFCANSTMEHHHRYHHTNGSVIRNTINNNEVIQAILDDKVDDFIRKSSEPSFNPNIRVFNMTYIQLMSLWGSIKCFKHAILTDLYDLKDIAPYAIAGGNMEIIHILEQKGISFDNVTDVHWVLQFITPEILNWLPQHYEFNTNLAVINAIRSRMFKYAWALLRFAEGENETLQYDDILLSAANCGNLSIVKYLVEECHCNVESKDRWWGFTPLHIASKKGYLSIVEYLTKECHCNVESKDNDGETPLLLASIFYHLDIVKYLTKERGANVESKDNLGRNPLRIASCDGHLDMVKYLVEECHCNVESKDDAGGTPLHFASSEGHLDIVKYLIEECHCNVEAQDNNGRTPLHEASYDGHLDIVKYLIEECHCNVESKDRWWGFTPLHIASKKGYLSIVQYLTKECGADVEAKDNNGYTPLHEASYRGNLDIVKYLVEECHAEITNAIIKDAENDQIKQYLQNLFTACRI